MSRAERIKEIRNYVRDNCPNYVEITDEVLKLLNTEIEDPFIVYSYWTDCYCAVIREVKGSNTVYAYRVEGFLVDRMEEDYPSMLYFMDTSNKEKFTKHKNGWCPVGTDCSSSRGNTPYTYEDPTF